MKLSYVVLLSEDVPASVHFWRDAMRLPLTYSDEAIGYAAFDIGSAGLTLSIYSRSGLATLLGEATPEPAGRQMYLSFPVDDVDTAYAELVERGASSVAPPQDNQQQQARLAHFSSPDGHIIEIAGPMRSSNAPNA